MVETFACPRCATSVNERYYGPCSSCRDDLRLRFGGQARVAEVIAFEPKMNVTPNQIASKD